MMARVAALMAACSLGACAVGPDNSYVASLPAATDAAVLASGICAYVKTQLPAAQTTLVLAPLPMGDGHGLAPVLVDALRRQGFAVALGDVPADVHTLRYRVTAPDQTGELVQLRIDGRKDAARFFVRNSAGGLQAGGPFTATQLEAAL